MRTPQPKCKEYANGDKVWRKTVRLLHREDGPAVEDYLGVRDWWLNGKRHREDGPAVERTNGNKEWWLNGKLHREDGPACECSNGEKWWYLNDEEVDPETIVDLWLAKNIYCFYNRETNSLEFD